MSSHVLQLNADYRPMKVITWRKAMMLIFDGKAVLETEYVGRLIRSAKEAFPFPAVVRLLEKAELFTRTKFNRFSLLARDGFTCAYCGVQPRTKHGIPDLEALTIDHVVPRAAARGNRVHMVADRSGRLSDRSVPVTCWENTIAACFDCNAQKGGRTPLEAGMPLRRMPRTPTPFDRLRISIALKKMAVPVEWKPYLIDDWENGYWLVELEAG